MIHIPTAPWAHYIGDLLAWSGAALAGRTLYSKRPELAGRLARVTETGYFIALGIGGALGAWVFGSLNTLRAATPTLSHSIAGALAGAIIAVELWKWRRGIRQSTGGAFVLPITVGIIIGRFGCFFAGLADGTYGTATNLAWAVELGDGIGRHPVQLYESASLAVFLVFYVCGLRRRVRWAETRAFHVLIMVYTGQRFIWEFLKPYPPLLGPFNLFHLLCLGLLIYGFVWYRRPDCTTATSV